MNKENYDIENDILHLHFGNKKTENSVELFEGKLVLDFDEDGGVVGFEIFDYLKEINKFGSKIKDIINKND